MSVKKNDDSRLNSGRIILTLSTFSAVLIAFCSRPEAVSDVTSGTVVTLMVSDKGVKFRDPR